MRRLALAALCVWAIPAAAMALTFDVDVSGYSDGSPAVGRKYFLAPAQEMMRHVSGLELKEFGGHAERALARKGVIRVFKGEDADTLVTLAYGIEDHSNMGGGKSYRSTVPKGP